MELFGETEFSDKTANKIFKHIRKGRTQKAQDMIDYHRAWLVDHVLLLENKELLGKEEEKQRTTVDETKRELNRLKEKWKETKKPRPDVLREEFENARLELKTKETGLKMLRMLNKTEKWKDREMKKKTLLAKKKRMLDVLEWLEKGVRMRDKHTGKRLKHNKKLKDSGISFLERRRIMR